MTQANGGRQERWKLTRSRMAFGLGAAILAHEVVIHEGAQRPYILLAALTLCGVASFLKLDEILRNAGINITVKDRIAGTERPAVPPEVKDGGIPNGTAHGPGP